MTLKHIALTLLSSESFNEQCRQALDQFANLCSEISNIEPDPGYTAWSGDTFLNQGVAINPSSAAYCIKDYQRSVVFIRGVYAALKVLKQRAAVETKVKVLYAGCGPFATLILPLLPLFEPGDLDICLLDIHQTSLDSVATLLKSFGLEDHGIGLVQADACQYQHPNQFDLVIAETMQKALEQEPQLSVTANLAGLLKPNGIFIPEEINVSLCLAHLAEEEESYGKHGKVDNQQLIDQGKRYSLGSLMQLSPTSVDSLMSKREFSDQLQNDVLSLSDITIPDIPGLETFQPLLLTQISVFGEHVLGDYDASLTLPSRCFDLEPLKTGETYHTLYVLGHYPKIHFQRFTE